MKIVFFGSHQSSIKVLSALLTHEYDVVAVVTKPYSPIQSFAKGAELKILTPENLSLDFIFYLKQLKADLGILFIYGKILPKELLQVFPKGIIGIHPSLLPKLRGPSPISTAILSGEKQTGVSLYLLDEKIDHGPLLAQGAVPIENSDTNFTLLERCAEEAARLLISTIPGYMEGEVAPRPQDESTTTYTKMLEKEEGRIDWGKDPLYIERMVRAYFPWPGAWTTLKELIKHEGGNPSKLKDPGKKVKILRAHLEEGELKIDELQLEGKSPIPWKQFAAGYLR